MKNGVPEIGDVWWIRLEPVVGHEQGTLVQRFGLVEELREVEVLHRAAALAAGAHAASDAEAASLLGRSALRTLQGDGTAAAHRRDVERVRLRRPDVRLP